MTERIDIVMNKDDGQKYGFRTENTTIVKSDEGSVSYNAGVRIGDMLVKINETTLGDDFNINQLANHISESGNSLKVTIERKTVISEEILTEVDGKTESEVQGEAKSEKKGLFGIGKMFAKKGDKNEENVGEISENKLDEVPTEKKPKKAKKQKKEKKPQQTENPVEMDQLPDLTTKSTGNWFSKVFGSKNSDFSPNTEGEITAQAPISVGSTLSKKFHFSSENLADPEIFIQGMEGGRPRACWNEIQKNLPEEEAERIENEGEDGYFSADLGTLKALSARQSKKIIKMRSLENRFEMKASFVNSL